MEAMHLQGNEESCLELENEQKMKEQPVLKKMSLPREHLILFSFGLLQGCILCWSSLLPMEGGQAGRQKMTSRATLISFDQNGEMLENTSTVSYIVIVFVYDLNLAATQTSL